MHTLVIKRTSQVTLSGIVEGLCPLLRGHVLCLGGATGWCHHNYPEGGLRYSNPGGGGSQNPVVTRKGGDQILHCRHSMRNRPFNVHQ